MYPMKENQFISYDTENLKTASQLLSEISNKFKEINEISGLNKISATANILSIVTSASSIRKEIKKIVEGSEKEMEKLSTSIKDSIKPINNAFIEVFNKSISKMNTQQLGRDIAKGIAEGMKDSIATIKMATSVICDKGIIAEFKAQMEINSPSKVMKRIASSIPEGIVDAIKDGQAGIKKAMGNSVEVIENASKKMSKIKFGLGGLTAITALVVPLIDYFGDMLSANETLGKKMEQIWAKIAEAFKPVTDAVMNLFNQFTTGSGGSVSALDTVLVAVNNMATVLAGVIETIAGFFKEYGDEIVTVVKGVWSVISDLVSGAVGVFGGAFDVIAGIFTGNGERIKDGFRDIYIGIKDIFGGLTGFFGGIWENIRAIFTNIGSTIGNGIGNAFKAVVNSISDFAGDLINKFIKAINKAIGSINKIPGVEIGKLPTINIPKLATGGIVTPGQLFVAREAGPELVGNFGARTAIMNNNQIVESVSRGVYNAVTDALNRNNSGPFVFHVHTYLDGREVAQNVIKHHNRIVNTTGYSPLKI